MGTTRPPARRMAPLPRSGIYQSLAQLITPAALVVALTLGI